MDRKHRHSNFSLKIQTTVLLLITAALFFVLYNLYPDVFSFRNVEKEDAAIKKIITEKQKNKRTGRVIVIQETGSNDKNISGDKTAATKRKSAVLAIVLDDGGDRLPLAKKAAALDMPLTFSIMPYRKYSAEVADAADKNAKPYLLHLPMQALSDSDNGSNAFIIGAKTEKNKIQKITSDAIDSLPNAIGINNHRGSLATESKDIIEPVLKELKRCGLIFLDSRTSAKSVAYSEAVAIGVPALKNDIFIDNVADEEIIKQHFDKAVRLAVKDGRAVVICHFRPMTLFFLQDLERRYRSLPVELVTIPQMIKAVGQEQ